MTIPIKTRIKRDHRLKVSEWRNVSKVAWKHAGEVWHDELLPKHFTEEGAREYRYKRRSRRHREKKLRRYGHSRPLEFSGELRRQVMRVRDVRVVGDNSRRRGTAKVVLHGPRHLYAFRRDLDQPNKAKELQAVSRADARRIGRVMDESLTRELGKTGRDEEVRP